MDFETLDKQIRRFEQSLDRTMLEGIYVVARLDGHGFTRLTKKEWDLEKPFDVRFRDAMIETTMHLMDCRFHYNDLPSWQKRGIGLFYLNEQRQGFNPVTKETTLYTRRALHVETELPIGQEYSQFLYAILENMNKENFTRTTPAVPCCSVYQSNSRQWQR